MKKHFTLGVGNYYFTIRNGGNSIMIKRKKKKEAIHAYESYQKIGKQCEWHGCWDGKKFTESSIEK